MACALASAWGTLKMRDMCDFIDSHQAAARAAHVHELTTTYPWILCHR
ncbi:hypothetical protein [Marinicella meishanensis]|nr:hypothetical protein [Marinicella sp. NBU2979]